MLLILLQKGHLACKKCAPRFPKAHFGRVVMTWSNCAEFASEIKIKNSRMKQWRYVRGCSNNSCFNTGVWKWNLVRFWFSENWTEQPIIFKIIYSVFHRFVNLTLKITTWKVVVLSVKFQQDTWCILFELSSVTQLCYL